MLGITAEKAEIIPIPQLPFHAYGYDLSSLNITLPHLIDPEGSFVIGLTYPTYQQDSPIYQYKGEVVVSYVGDEDHFGVPTRKYQIDGTGLEQRGGFIWVNKVGGYIEDMEIDLPDNPDWQSFKFRLQGIEQMDQAAWEAFMAAQF